MHALMVMQRAWATLLPFGKGNLKIGYSLSTHPFREKHRGVGKTAAKVVRGIKALGGIAGHPTNPVF
jgi:hypothetical protein